MQSKRGFAALAFTLAVCVAQGAAQVEAWQQIATAHNMGPRGNTAMAFDPSRGYVLLFAGQSTNPNQDTFTYDGVDWTKRFPVTLPIYGTTNHAMAYHPLRQRIMMCGDVYTWEWDGTDWIQLSSSSPFMSNGGMAWDPVAQRMLRFGGAGATGDQTYGWNGTQWQLLATGTPPARTDLMLVTDTVRQRVLLYGGYGPAGGYGSRFNDTWAWNGSSWTQLPVAPGPYLSNQAVVYDSAKGWAMMYAGEIPQASGPTTNRDLWVFDGASWNKRVLSPKPNLFGIRPPIAYDSIRKKTVFYGEGQTWEYTPPPQVPATFVTFGAGCAGTAGVPTLAQSGGLLPYLGTTFPVRISNLSTSGFRVPFGLLGASKTTWSGFTLPLDLTGVGMPGCTLYTGGEVVVQLQASAGSATWGIAIPFDPALVGAKAFQQIVVIDPGANALGFVTSNATELTIGQL